MLKQIVNIADTAEVAHINIIVCVKITLGEVIPDVIEIAGCSTRNSVQNHYNMGNAFVKSASFITSPAQARPHVNQIGRNTLQSAKNTHIPYQHSQPPRDFALS